MRPLFYFLLLLSPFAAFSQSSFELKDLQLPDVQRYVLQLNLGTVQESNFAYSSTNKQNHEFGFNFSTTYQGYKNFRYKQTFSSAGFELSPTLISSRNSLSSNADRNKSLLTGGSYRIEQYFYNQQYQFIGYTASVHGNFSGNTTNADLAIRNEKSSYNTGVDGLFHFGIGRLDPIDQGQMAFFMLRDLKRDYALSKDASADDFVALSSLIATLNRVRNFDARWRRIEQAEALDSFFKNRGLIEHSTAAFYTRVYDNFFFTNSVSRINGIRWKIGIGPNFNRDFDFERSSGQSANQTVNQIDLDLVIQREAYGQISNYVQQKSLYTLAYARETDFQRNWNSLVPTSSELERTQSFVSLFAERSYGFYPTTRTYVNIGANAGTFSPADSLISKRINFNAAVRANGYYYISPATRLSFSVRVASTMRLNSLTQNESDFITQFNIRLLHNIF
ncbi:MAG: hypothetical protein KDC92_02015 [Bacteroidetes bacterium]|nr:hypothetical protein [Bacteroidota bacterium]